MSGTTVTIGGHPAAVAYVSPTQVNVQVPNVGTGVQPVIVTTAQGASGSYTATVHTTVPELFAPGSFHVGGVQYVAAILPDGSFAFPHDSVSGSLVASGQAGRDRYLVRHRIWSRDAGSRFGPARTRREYARAADGNSHRPGAGDLQYSGLSPGSVGLYQFNVVIPDGVSGTVPVTFTLGGVPGSQSLSITVEP